MSSHPAPASAIAVLALYAAGVIVLIAYGAGRLIRRAALARNRHAAEAAAAAQTERILDEALSGGMPVDDALDFIVARMRGSDGETAP